MLAGGPRDRLVVGAGRAEGPSARSIAGSNRAGAGWSLSRSIAVATWRSGLSAAAGTEA